MSVRATVEEAVNIIKNGGMIILTDDEDRENEGDLVIGAQFATQENINFMAKEGRGLICLSLTPERCDELGLELMRKPEDNKSKFGTAFTVSIEARDGVTTGISANDRAVTVLTAIDPSKGAGDIAVPGHIFPLRSRKGGVLVRAGQTEGSVDLARLAGINPSAVICEVMNEDGTMSRMPQLEVFAAKHGLKILTVADLIAYRSEKDSVVEKVAEAKLPTAYGDFTIMGFKNTDDGQEAVALVKGDVSSSDNIMVRVHSSCLTGDVFGSKRCDCGKQLHIAMEMIDSQNAGVLLYMFQEGRGIGILNKIKAYSLQDDGCDTVDANIKLGFKDDLRDYGFGAQILRSLGIRNMRLLTNNPVKISGLSGYGLNVTERIPIVTEIDKYNEEYMKTKESRMGHILGLFK